MRRLPLLVRQLHIYAGLQALIASVVFGLTGIGATIIHDPSYEPPPYQERLLALELGPEASPRQAADRACERLALPLAKAPGNWALTPDARGQIQFSLKTPTAHADVRIAPGRDEAFVRTRPLSLLETFVALHEVRLPRPLSSADLRITLWALYIEVSTWSLWFFVVTGLYLWLATKPLRPLAVGSFASGCIALVASVIWMW